jgi:hypothetical protein
MKEIFFSVFSLWKKYKILSYLNLIVILFLSLTFNLAASGYGENKSNLMDNPQQVTVRGTVTDASTGEALPGVNVVIPGTTTGTMTDVSGEYSLEVPNASVKLQFSFIGYVTQEVALGGQSTLNVALSSDVAQLSEVVVVGYTSQKKSALTGAVSTVDISNLEQRKVAELGQILQGQVAGVQVTQSTGAPGDDINITIRGVGTIGSSSAPLFIVDGLPIYSR